MGTDDLKRVGLVFKADGAVDFKKSIQQVNDSIQENRNAFKLAKTAWDDSTSAMDKLQDRQEYLAKQTETYSDKVKILEEELKALEGAEERDEQAIRKKRSQLTSTQAALINYEKGLKDVENDLKHGITKTKEYAQKIDDFGNKVKSVGDKLSGISTAAAGVAAAAAATVPATEEYRRIMASLESSSELAGYTAEQTEQTYRQLFGVLGDDQTAATTTANLQALGFEQDRLTQLVNGTVGAWAKYGDSIPIDGLAESINETIKAGAVTGTFADVLNWAGTSEDWFNERLEACGSEAERANLVMQELAEQGLMEAGQKWQDNNQTIVEGNQATADFKAATAELAETIAPIITRVTEIAAGLLEKFNALPSSTQEIIAVVILLVATLAPLINAFGSTITGAKTLWAVMAAHPMGAIITVLSLLVAGLVTAYNKFDWFREMVDNVFESIKKVSKGIGDFFKKAGSFVGSIFGSSSSYLYQSVASTAPMPLSNVKMDWYAKGGILNRPTIFGRNGDSLLGGGEAGKEAVLPIDLLKQYIREENNANNAVLADMLMGTLSEMKIEAENNVYIGDKKFFDVITEMVVGKIGSRQSGKNLAMGVW